MHPQAMNMKTQTRFRDAFTLEPIPEPPPSALTVGDTVDQSCLVGPAFFDPQVNGFGGVEFADPDLGVDELENAVLAIRQAGCSHFLLTLVTNALDALEDQFKRLASLVDQSGLIRESLIGFHLEGPFISPEPGYRGAHRAEHVRPPDWSSFERLQNAAGDRIRMLTLAPEWPGGAEFIRRAAASGVFVCLGHTNADYRQLRAAIDAGARMVTHLGNGLPLDIHRHDNIIQRVLAMDELLASLIPDGIHLPPFVLKNLARALGRSRLVFTTDAVTPAGAPPGEYQVGHQKVMVGDDRVVRNADGRYLAGSALTMHEGFLNSVNWCGLDIPSAWHAWTWLREIISPGIKPPMLILPDETSKPQP